MAAGSIVIDLLMKTSSFQTDTDRAAKIADRRAKEIQKSFEDAGAKIAIGFTAAFAAVGAGYYAFDRLIKQVGDFQDIAEKTGGSAAGFAGFAVAAGTTNTAMESLVESSIKLAKNLTGVDDEGKKAGAALAALGLNIQDFKKLNPEERIDAIAKALAKFQDGVGKTEVLEGLVRGGSQLLPFLKELEAQGGRQNVLTSEQIKLADEYADRQGKARAELNLYAQSLAINALPAVTAFTGALSDSIKEILSIGKDSSDLAGNSGVKDFADSAAIAVAKLADTVYDAAGLLYAFAGSVSVVFADIRAASAIASYTTPGGLLARAIGIDNRELKTVLDEREKVLKDANSRYERLSQGLGLEARVTARIAGRSGEIATALGQDPRELARRGRPVTTLPQLDFNGAASKTGKGGGGKDQDSDFRSYLSNLERQIQKTQELSAVEKVLDDIRRGSLTVNTSQKNQLLALAGIVDKEKELTEQLKMRREASAAAGDAVNKANEEYTQLLDRLLDSGPAAQLEKQREAMLLLTDAFNTGRISAEQFNDAATGFLNLGKAIEEADSFAKKFAENVQDSLGNGLYDIMQGNFKNIGASFKQMLDRMVAEAIAADLARRMFGSLAKGGSGDGWIGAAVSAVSGLFGGGTSFDSTAIPTGDFARMDRLAGARADGGPVSGGSAYLIGERGPEVFVPRTAGMVLPNDVFQGQRSGGDVYQEVKFYNNGPIDRTAQINVAAAALRGARKGQRVM